MTTAGQIEFCNFGVEFSPRDGRRVAALEGVNLVIHRGQFVCIVGRSGGGKSTLVRALAGLVQTSVGSLTVNGASVTGPGEDRVMVFQEDTVFPWLRVLDNVEFGLRNRAMTSSGRQAVARRWLAAVGLTGVDRAWPKELSGGMRKRVALATVFATGAGILIMDEPFGALDFVTRATLHDVLLSLWRSVGATIVFVTHDIEEALVLGDRILVISDGRVRDDLVCDLPRPRIEEVRSSPAAVELTKTIIRRLDLGFDAPASALR
jgi:NitT/TauT family transport system ATP-binding protein